MIIKECIFEPRRYWGPYGSTPPPVGWHDDSRFHHDLVDAAGVAEPDWVQNASGLWVKEFDGINDYADAANADTVGLGVTSGMLDGYTIMGWINWADTGNSEIVIGRYEVDVGGWELYLYHTGGVYSLNQRHHHAGLVVDLHPRSATYSNGWTEGVTWHFAVVYNGNGTDCTHYRNGVAVAVVSSTGSIRDFLITNQDLVVGTRYTKDGNWYEGWLGLPKIFNWSLNADQVNAKFASERHWLDGA